MVIALFSEGGPYERGLAHGLAASSAIRENVRSFWSSLSLAGLSRNTILNKIKMDSCAEELGEEVIQYIKGLASGSSVMVEDIIALNLIKGKLFPEGCTVFIAMKDSTANGRTMMLKNSDKVGSEKLVGSRFYMNKEINVLVMEKPDDGYGFVAVAAAGEVSIKMGMNERGVATGSNIARTVELKQRKVDITQIRALDRGWLMREGITRGGTADDAAKIVLGKLLENPMSTPGNIEFVDSKTAQLIEGSYDRVAIQKVTSGVVARSNRFVILSELNDPEDISSYARLVRASKLLNDNKGTITVEKLIEFSQDHENGPGPNSICRHSEDYRSETSLSAAVMEINEENPAKSIFYACLGKPCHAWRSREGHIAVSLDGGAESIPSEFRDGSAFKKYYTEEPQRT